MNLTQKRWWPAFKRIAGLLYLSIVAWLLIVLARDMDWSKVVTTVFSMPPLVVASAVFLASISHLVYSSFDLIGRKYTRHHLTSLRVMAVTFVSYVGNLNFGALIGGIGLRQRIYSRCGLPLSTIARVAGLSMISNWLGYLFLAALLLIGPTYASIVPDYLPDGRMARALGVVMLVAVIGYVALGWWRGGRDVWPGRLLPLHVPSIRMVLTQLCLATLNWSIMALVIHRLLDAQIRFDQVLLTLLAAAIAGVVAHIPGGLGVIEATFVLLLEGRVAREELLGVVIAYRAIYYLLPLPIALIVWLRLESSMSSRSKPTYRGVNAHNDRN